MIHNISKNKTDFIFLICIFLTLFLAINYNPFIHSLFNEINNYYNLSEYPKLGSHLKNNLLFHSKYPEITNFFFFSNLRCESSYSLLVEIDFDKFDNFCPFFGSYYINIILYSLYVPDNLNYQNIDTYINFLTMINVSIFCLLFSLIILKIYKEFSFNSSIFLLIAICFSPYLTVWGVTLGETIIFLILSLFLGLLLGKKFVLKNSFFHLFLIFVTSLLNILSKYQYAQFGLLFLPFFYIYYSLISKIKLKDILIGSAKIYLIGFLSLIVAILYHVSISNFIINNYQLSSEFILENNNNFLLGVITEKFVNFNNQGGGCSLGSYSNHIYQKLISSAIWFNNHSIVTFIYLIFSLLLIYSINLKYKFLKEKEKIFYLLSLCSLIILLPAIRVWCVNLLHAYDEVINYLPFLLFLYICIGFIYDKALFFSKKYFSIFLLIFLNVLSMYSILF